jgi:hypothetical protein
MSSAISSLFKNFSTLLIDTKDRRKWQMICGNALNVCVNISNVAMALNAVSAVSMWSELIETYTLNVTSVI